ncbi:MAG: hypothetical protein U1E73_01730 [Planctomycetota bacterium]
MNRARTMPWLPLVVASACALPKFAQFPPLPADVACHRVDRGSFSVLVPDHWREFGEAGPDDLHFVEDAPANGEIHAYRALVVRTREPIAGDDPAAITQAGLAALCARHANDNLAVVATGTASLAGRDCAFLQGTITPSSYEVVLETLCYLVPGEGKALVVEFTVPAGQLDAARPGFAAIAQSLQTPVPPPRAGGELLWLDGDRVGVFVPDGWMRAADAGPALAAFTFGDGEAHCEVSTATSENGYDLARLAQGYERDQAPQWPDLCITAVERGTLGGRAFVRFRGAYRDELGTVFVDDTFVVAGDRLDRVLCRVPHGEPTAALASAQRLARSLRWR